MDFELRNLFSIVAVAISVATYISTRKFWFLTYRPIVTAEIIVNSSGIGMATFDLVVYNSGNRPAVNIKLYAERTDIENILSTNITQEKKKEVIGVFSSCNKIALLLNDKDAKTAFFSFSNQVGSDADWLQYERELPIVISYSDISGKEYSSNIILHIRGAEGFGGSVWAKQ